MGENFPKNSRLEPLNLGTLISKSACLEVVVSLADLEIGAPVQGATPKCIRVLGP